MDKIRQEFASWEWIFGKTPKFAVEWPLRGEDSALRLEVHRGIIEAVKVNPSTIDAHLLTDVLTNQKLDLNLFQRVTQTNWLNCTQSNASLKKLLTLLIPSHLS